MADTKITALTAIGANPIIPSTFPIPMVDLTDTSMAASGTTKKVTVNQILQAGGTATLASATITGDLTVDTSTLKVDSANNRVGIGTASPGFPLHVQSGTAVFKLESTTGTNPAYLYATNTGGDFYFGRDNSTGTTFGTGTGYSAVLYSANAYPMVFFANAIERYRIASDGVATWSNVGGVAGTAMTLNSTGLGVGDTPASNTRLTVAAASRLADTTGQAYIHSTDAQAQDIGAQLTLGGLYNASAHYAFGGIAGRKENSTSGNVAGYLDFLTTTSGGSLTSRMRIDSSGNLLVARTGAGLDNTSGVTLAQASIGMQTEGNAVQIAMNRTTSDGNIVDIRRNNSTVGTIAVTTAGTTYNSISDYRLKEAVQPLAGGLARVNALKPSIYKWKSNGSSGEGFIAHELAEIVPAAVTGEKDAVNEDGTVNPQGVDLSKVVPILVAAIKELTAEVNALKNA